MRQYLTIREFAKLRNIDVNSLRYYEKLNILSPAWVDPKTKYRYYTPEQLVTLDIIILCIRLGIPLKQLREYVDGDGKIDKRRILEDGKAAMQDRIAEMQLGLELIQFNLNTMEQNQRYSDRPGVYGREIPERFLVRAPFKGDWEDLAEKESAAMELFQAAQERGLAPVFPAGILVLPGERNPFSFFFQVLHPLPGEDVLRVPAGTFCCMQIDLTPETQILKLLDENFPHRGREMAIISNMALNKLHFNSRHSEIQVAT